MSAFQHASISANERQPKESTLTVNSAQCGGDRTKFPTDFSAAASVCIVVLQREIIGLSHTKEKCLGKVDRSKCMRCFLLAARRQLSCAAVCESVHYIRLMKKLFEIQATGR